jgi:hypothetical protein
MGSGWRILIGHKEVLQSSCDGLRVVIGRVLQQDGNFSVSQQADEIGGAQMRANLAHPNGARIAAATADW